MDDSRHYGYWTTVTLTSGEIQQGYFYTMDPDSKSMILYAQNTAIVVMGHSIQHYTVDDQVAMDGNELVKAMHCQWDHVPSTEQLDERKQGLIDYMEKRRIPITYSADDPVIMVLGCARVGPPYVSTSVTCDENVILLKRVRDMVCGYQVE